MRLSSVNNLSSHTSALRAISRKFLFSFLFAGGFFAVSDVSALIITLQHQPKGVNSVVYNLSWTAVAPSTSGALVSYYVFQEFGANGVGGTSNPANAIVVTNDTGINLEYYPGSRCFVVISSDSLGGPAYSDMECHGFIHNLTGEGIQREDGDGTQRGVDQKWTFTYSLDVDAYMTARIYPPGTQFTVNSNNFIISASSPVVNTLVENTPRSGELANHNVTMEETWDSRSSTGVIVPNGIYYLVMSATLDTGFFPTGNVPDESTFVATPESLLRDSVAFTIPVDIIRIMRLSATAITQTNATSQIRYDLTGDANVRVIFAQPNSSFSVDVDGNIRTVNRTTGLIDDTLTVSSFTFQRKAGTNIESWDGTSSSGTVLGSGVYAVGISASDPFGNHAIDAAGNDFPIFTTITLERSAGSSSGSNTASDTTAPTLTSITPSNGSTSSSPISSIVAQLADAETSINISGSVITVRDPNNVAVPGVMTNNGADTLTFTPTDPLEVSGTYTVSITALNTGGLSTTYTRTFSVNIRLDSEALKGSLALFPNPAKNTPATIQYSLSVDAEVEIEVFNILGERVYNVTYSDTQSNLVSHTWDLKNNSGKKVGSGLYLVRIKAKGIGSDADAIKKLVVVQ